MGEALLEGQELALFRSVVGFRKDRHGSPNLQAAIHVVKQGLVAVTFANDGDVATRVPDQPPLELARHQVFWVGEKVQARLDRKQQQERELVEPVEVVGDDYVCARTWGVLAAFGLELEAEPSERHDSAEVPVRGESPAAAQTGLSIL